MSKPKLETKTKPLKAGEWGRALEAQDCKCAICAERIGPFKLGYAKPYFDEDWGTMKLHGALCFECFCMVDRYKSLIETPATRAALETYLAKRMADRELTHPERTSS